METAFREGTIRIPLSGEGAYAERVAVVVGELVITKLPVYERHVVHGTVRIEHVSAEERSAEHVVPDRADATTLRRAA